MCVLRHEDILEWLKNGNLVIEQYSEEELKANSYRARAGEEFFYTKDPDNIYSFQKELILKAGKSLVIYSLENFILPKNLCGISHSRVQLLMAGLLSSAAIIEPGYKGHLRIYLKNETNKAVRLTKGMPICNVMFLELSGETKFPPVGGIDYGDSETFKKLHPPKSQIKIFLPLILSITGFLLFWGVLTKVIGLSHTNAIIPSLMAFMIIWAITKFTILGKE